MHFLERFLQRVQALGIRFNPATFGQRFERARHYRQARPGYATRVAVVDGLPIVYRMGGPCGRHVVLVTLLGRRPAAACIGARAGAWAAAGTRGGAGVGVRRTPGCGRCASARGP
jgi:hypothetical protein